MSEREFQPELDDELLSAYLDNELTAAERAAVEARLANDPEAQQLLHQLRSVSQSVQMLPLEGVGRNLSDEIMRRVEAKKRGDGGAESGGSPELGDVTPSVTVFGSRRSWIWATLALAAGLMIMVLERGQEKGKQLPAVARNDGSNAKPTPQEKLESVGGQTKMPAGNSGNHESKVVSSGAPGAPNAGGAPGAPAAALTRDAGAMASRELPAGPSGGGVLAGDSSTSDRLADSGQARELHDSPTQVGGGMRKTAQGSLSASGGNKSAVAKDSERNAAPRPESVTSESDVVASTATSKPADLDRSGADEATIEDTNALVVVHVSAKPAAIRGGEFEKLLARNGVEFDEKDKTEEANSSADSKKSLARSAESHDVSRATNADKKSVDMVVVDAPRDVVAACMADLQQDASNFASVEVEQPAATQATAPAAPDLAKQLGSELRQYNRGMVAEKQLPGSRFYAYDSPSKDRAQSKEETNQPAAVNGGTPPQNNQQLQNERAAQVNRGRALRVQVAQDDNQALRDPQFERRANRFGGEGNQSATRRSTPQQQKSQNENWDEVRVLFMLSTESASPPPTKKAAE